jgi:hypothetical protein
MCAVLAFADARAVSLRPQEASHAKGSALTHAREGMRCLETQQASRMADATALIGELVTLLKKDLRDTNGRGASGADAGECWPAGMAAAPGSKRTSGGRIAPGSVGGGMAGDVHKAACVRRAVRFTAAQQAAAAAAAAMSPLPAAAVTASLGATPPAAKRFAAAGASPGVRVALACSPLNMR